jgi:SOS-response transcriptional repressor LexA
MSIRYRISRDDVRDYITAHHKDTGHRPSQVELAAAFDASQTHMSRIVRELDDMNALPGEPLGRRTEEDIEDRLERTYQFITDYMAENTWAPTRREIAEGVDVNLAMANYLVAVLANRGRIEVGSQSRQIRFPKRRKK